MTNKHANCLSIWREMVTTISCNYQRAYQYSGKAITRDLRKGWWGLLKNIDNGFMSGKDYSMKEVWHVCLMIYWSLSIFPIVVHNFNSIMAKW
jgi:hypothetical protein